MPLVVVTHEVGRVPPDMLIKLARALPEIVAQALNVEENEHARLTVADIEVRVQESGPYDFNVKDLEIIIWANDYPERLVNLDERKETILKGVREFLRDFDRNLSGFVWVLLQPTAFGEI